LQQEARAWREENDPLAEFLASEVVVLGDELRLRSLELFKAYDHWARSEDIPKGDRLSQRAFGRLMKSRFKAVRPGGVTWYVGIWAWTGDPS
jgi:phage/plasmid-associated DNA primase